MPSPIPTAPPPIAITGDFLFDEDFERGLGRWTITGGAGGVGWRRLQAATCGGAYTMILGRVGAVPFADVTGEAMLTLRAPLDLRRARRPLLVFDVMGAVSPAEAIAIQAEGRRPGGTWRALGAPAVGRFPMVVSRYADMAGLAGGRAELRFRATFRPLGAPARGVFLDDVLVVEPAGPAKGKGP